MVRLIVLLLIIAAVAAFFTRPDEAKMRAAADAALNERTEQALEDLDIGGFAQSGAAAMLGDRAYTNYYLASRYVLTLDNEPVVSCWGLFTQVQCSRSATGDGVSG
jgi:hypothetical protein